VLLTQKILHCLSTSGQPISLFPFVSLEQVVQFGWGEALENCSARHADFSFRLRSTHIRKVINFGFTRPNPMGIERYPINVQLPLHHEFVVSSGDYRGRTQASLAGLPYLVHERPANKGNFSPITIMISPVPFHSGTQIFSPRVGLHGGLIRITRCCIAYQTRLLGILHQYRRLRPDLAQSSTSTSLTRHLLSALSTILANSSTFYLQPCIFAP
jgi:hypothetical protein